MCEYCNVCACLDESPERSLQRRVKKIKSDTKNLEKRRDSLIDKLTRLRKEALLSGSCNQKTRSPLKWLDARDAALLPPTERSPEEVKRAQKRVFGQASERQGEFHTSLFAQTQDETWPNCDPWLNECLQTRKLMHGRKDWIVSALRKKQGK